MVAVATAVVSGDVGGNGSFGEWFNRRDPFAAGGGEEGPEGASWWMFLGGACGGTVVASNIVGTDALGAAFYSTCFVTSQLVVAFLFDCIGALGFRRVPPTTARISGIVLAIVAAAAFSTLDNDDDDDDDDDDDKRGDEKSEEDGGGGSARDSIIARSGGRRGSRNAPIVEGGAIAMAATVEDSPLVRSPLESDLHPAS